MVFTRSPSPQTIIRAKRLNHGPVGTVGSASSHAPRLCRSWWGTYRSRTLRTRCAMTAGGTFLRRTLGIAVESFDEFLFETVSFFLGFRVDHSLRDLPEFLGRKGPCFEFHFIA